MKAELVWEGKYYKYVNRQIVQMVYEGARNAPTISRVQRPGSRGIA